MSEKIKYKIEGADFKRIKALMNESEEIFNKLEDLYKKSENLKKQAWDIIHDVTKTHKKQGLVCDAEHEDMGFYIIEEVDKNHKCDNKNCPVHGSPEGAAKGLKALVEALGEAMGATIIVGKDEKKTTH